MPIVLIAVNTILSAFVMWCAICATNRMNKQTRMTVRAGYVVLGTAAAASLFYPFWFDETPGMIRISILLGIAALFFGDKRKGALA
ncbi:MAG: hypothetical protein CMJ75_19250 [Planctomycetaceae bacterium]|nr:hypothetical protein [Planctomycetaceae bacterium]